MKSNLHLLALLLAAPGLALDLPDKDSDGDGLSDFAEEHKHFTDPALRDSDSDGTPVGDPYERREYSYSVRTVIRVMKPYDVTAMNDDYQDTNLLREIAAFGEIEVTRYPLNTVAQGMRTCFKSRL